MKKIVILGSSGSIGENAVRVVESLPGLLKISGLAVNTHYERALEQAKKFNVEHIAVADPNKAELCRKAAPANVKVYSGSEGVRELAAMNDVDMVLCALVGMSGLRPVLAAVENGTDVALATKEVLVAAGAIVTAACKKTGARLLPVDSEHSALFQCLEGNCVDDVNRLILTASGGPFMAHPEIDFNDVTVDQALAHPKWNMGKKVSIDSATLMNKGLEIMEAHWLFNVPFDKIDVIVHPESIIHSLVEFVDRSILSQMSVPDMRFAIQHALLYPERVDGALPALNLFKTGQLNFIEPNLARFPCLSLARKAALRGGTLPAVLNAANEVAVNSFLEGAIRFSSIWRIVEDVMEMHDTIDEPDLEAVIEADAWARKRAVDPDY